MGEHKTLSDDERWGQFRLSVIGHLLSAPPVRGRLMDELKRLAAKTWRDPITGKPCRYAVSTLEHWYYQARRAMNPMDVLRRKIRSDRGTQRVISGAVRDAFRAQYQRHNFWSWQLHFDNLCALAEEDSGLRPMPSYSSFLRYAHANGFIKHRRLTGRNTEGALRAQQRLAEREVRSYEVEYVNALWHMDFHVGSLRVLTRRGEWAWPCLCGILDDRSRLGCHVQWYFSENTENACHGLRQGFQKRKLPRALMTDEGSAETALEFTGGLDRLSVSHDTTLPYSPHQNAKQEVFWDHLEGRVMAMLQGVEDLTLEELNLATLAWLEREYNRKPHSETGEAPLERYLAGPDVGRPCPSSEVLRSAFIVREERSQRKSDGTVSISGGRFEIPSRYRCMRRVWVGYARWDLSRVELLDPRTRKPLCRIFPVDKAANAEGRRRLVKAPPFECASGEAGVSDAERFPPLLRKLIADYAGTGLPPGYLPKDDTVNLEEEEG